MPSAGCAVAAGAADLLPVGLDRRRRIGVDDVAHVGLVDAHAEGDGGDHHGGVRFQELLEPGGAQVLVETGVIGQRRHAGGDQLLGQLVDAVARAGIDHAGALGPLGHQLQHAAVALPALALRRQGQLGPREAVDELAGVLELQLGADVVAGAGIGRGGDGEARHVREDLGQAAQHAVLGAEVVAPLADAVGFVDGDQRQRQAGQALQHRRLHQAFGREVEQVQRAVVDAAPDVAAGVGGGGGVQPLRRHARLLQGGDLVGHQRDQRRDDEAEAGPDQRRDLVAQALAAAGRQHGQRAAPGQHFADHAGLQTAELGMAEGAAQDVARGIERRGLAGIGSAELGIGIHGCVMQRARPSRKPARRVFNHSARGQGHRKGYLILRGSTAAVAKSIREW